MVALMKKGLKLIRIARLHASQLLVALVALMKKGLKHSILLHHLSAMCCCIGCPDEKGTETNILIQVLGSAIIVLHWLP